MIKRQAFGRCNLNELKNRGVQDIMIICADGLTGIKEAITAAFLKGVRKIINTTNAIESLFMNFVYEFNLTGNLPAAWC